MSPIPCCCPSRRRTYRSHRAGGSGIKAVHTITQRACRFATETSVRDRNRASLDKRLVEVCQQFLSCVFHSDMPRHGSQRRSPPRDNRQLRSWTDSSGDSNRKQRPTVLVPTLSAQKACKELAVARRGPERHKPTPGPRAQHASRPLVRSSRPPDVWPCHTHSARRPSYTCGAGAGPPRPARSRDVARHGDVEVQEGRRGGRRGPIGEPPRGGGR